MRPIGFKIMFDRIKNYIAMIQFVMVGYLFIVQTEFDFWMTVAGVAIVSIIVSILDYKWILPNELNAIARKNPVMHELISRLSRIEAKVEGTYLERKPPKKGSPRAQLPGGLSRSGKGSRFQEG